MRSFGDNKVCSHCRSFLKVSHFYKNRSTVDGYEYCCKECSKESGKKWRRGNPEKVRTMKRIWRQKNVEKQSEYHRNWREKNRKYNNFSQLARRKVAYALETGKLARGGCRDCGVSEDTHAHHEDYSKPFQIIWLCPPCHRKRHKQFKRT